MGYFAENKTEKDFWDIKSPQFYFKRVEIEIEDIKNGKQKKTFFFKIKHFSKKFEIQVFVFLENKGLKQIYNTGKLDDKMYQCTCITRRGDIALIHQDSGNEKANSYIEVIKFLH